MKKMKYLTLALVINSSVFSYANANEIADVSLSLTSTIDALLKQNLDELQPLNTAEDSKVLLVSSLSKKLLGKSVVEFEDTKQESNNAAKLTE